jgi:hypothetical protein
MSQSRRVVCLALCFLCAALPVSDQAPWRPLEGTLQVIEGEQGAPALALLTNTGLLLHIQASWDWSHLTHGQRVRVMGERRDNTLVLPSPKAIKAVP